MQDEAASREVQLSELQQRCKESSESLASSRKDIKRLRKTISTLEVGPSDTILLSNNLCKRILELE